MTAPDIGDRIRWTLDLYTKSLDENGDPEPDGWLVAADGAGNNEYVDPLTIVAAASFVPTFLASGSTFTVPENTQALYAMPIDNEGILDIVGFLIEVD